MCNCKETIQDKMLERLAEKHPEATECKAQLEGYVFPFSTQGLGAMALTVNCRLDFKLPKKGGDGVKKGLINEPIMVRFCPFCGEERITP